MKSDEDRDAKGLARLPMRIPHRHTREGGYPESDISLEIVYLRT